MDDHHFGNITKIDQKKTRVMTHENQDSGVRLMLMSHAPHHV